MITKKNWKIKCQNFAGANTLSDKMNKALLLWPAGRGVKFLTQLTKFLWVKFATSISQTH